jgi:hypothetical protein
VTQKEIRKQDVVILDEAADQLIMQPGWVSALEEQQLIDKLKWEIKSCTEQ